MELNNNQIESLLGRKTISNEYSNKGSYIKGKVCFITGGGGSIGEALVTGIMSYLPKEIHIIENCESKVYELKQKLSLKNKQLPENIYIHLSDIRDYRKMKYLYRTYKPNIVYHTAAYKHVNIMEDNPEEAINNNVRGTLKIAKLAYKYKSERVILVSSDKAVHPINIMGMTKRLSEMVIYFFAKQSRYTLFSTVRLVNVFGSSGSIVPSIINQVQNGGPVTITSKDVERFFMTMSEAVYLIITAGNIEYNGQVTVMNVVSGVNIASLAKKIIKLCTEHEKRNINLLYIGLAKNEKIKELILYDNEIPYRKGDSEFSIFSRLIVSTNVFRFYFELYYLFWLCKKMKRNKIIKLLKEIICT